MKLRSLLARLGMPTRTDGLRPYAVRGMAGVAASPPIDVAETIERALSAAGLRPRDGAGDQAGSAPSQILPRTPAAAPNAPPPRPKPRPAARNRVRQVPPASDGPQARGTSLERAFGNAAGERAYTLHVPAGHPDTHAALPLVVMLHGCTQDPADFAAGTRMNALADRHGVLVAYPAQPQRDNGSRCWNWFRPQDQLRDAGEPSILAGIVAHVAADHRVDQHRVYVAGLSAGAAMAVILGRTYPDVFAAVGAHSGLPFAAAHDVASAFKAMQGTMSAGASIGAVTRDRRVGTSGVMPTIVFHGNADHTVHQRNGTAIVRDAVADAATGTPLMSQRVEAVAGGRRHTRETFLDADGRTMVEHWVLHGAGHAWSGGDPAGSHVDPTGPDASAEMLRFFLQHAQAGAA